MKRGRGSLELGDRLFQIGKGFFHHFAVAGILAGLDLIEQARAGETQSFLLAERFRRLGWKALLG